jgi:hypothetical protein
MGLGVGGVCVRETGRERERESVGVIRSSGERSEA